jgi:acetyl esterase/lipase
LDRIGWAAYLGAEPDGPHIPDYAVAARRADLPGLPPAWISVGDIDLFAGEDRAYIQHLRDAGVDCTFDVVPGAPHGFEVWAPDTRVPARSWNAAAPPAGHVCPLRDAQRRRVTIWRRWGRHAKGLDVCRRRRTITWTSVQQT